MVARRRKSLLSALGRARLGRARQLISSLSRHEQSQRAVAVSDAASLLHFFDQDNDGKVNVEEIEQVLRSLSIVPDAEKMRYFVESTDADGDGVIDLTEMAAGFAALDPDGDGTVTLSELAAAFKDEWAVVRVLRTEAAAVFCIEVVWSGTYGALMPASTGILGINNYVLVDYLLRLAYTLLKFPGCGNAMFFSIACGRGNLTLRMLCWLVVVQVLAILAGRFLLLELAPSGVAANLVVTPDQEGSLLGDAPGLAALLYETRERALALCVGTLMITQTCHVFAQAIPEAAWLLSPALGMWACQAGLTDNVAYTITTAVWSGRSFRPVWVDVAAVLIGAAIAGALIERLQVKDAPVTNDAATTAPNASTKKAVHDKITNGSDGNVARRAGTRSPAPSSSPARRRRRPA